MSKILIAYYSRADENYLNGALRYIKKGNTEKVAEHIQKRIGGDLFKIEQIQPYRKDYNSCIAEAQEDLKRNARPQLKAYPDSIDDYTDIYLGYPIYWGTFPMAVWTFLDRFDFRGKNIHPFCTHEGSEEGRSILDLKRLCPNSTITDVLALHGASVDYSLKEIDSWLNSIERNKK